MCKRIMSLFVIFCFFLTSLMPYTKAHADAALGLPAPGAMIDLSPAYAPVMIKGLTVHKDNPFLFDFIVDVGQDRLSGEPLKQEGEKLIKYFLAGLAIPDQDLWVNLSPYEKSKIVPEVLGQTDMGRDLLEQDYILKQITASLIYPEKSLGKLFWDKVYAKSQQMYGSTQIPINTFNKVWIIADSAQVFQHNQTAFVVNCHLKVMLEEDYLALQKHMSSNNSTVILSAAKDLNASYDSSALPQNDKSHTIVSKIIRSIIIPELEKEVNTGKNFANLRQIFNSVVLSSWYKRNLKQALLNQAYANKSRVKGINLNDPTIKEQIYKQYLEAYKKGVFNFIKDDAVSIPGVPSKEQGILPRKYFSGGTVLAFGDNLHVSTTAAMGTAALQGQAWHGVVNFETAFLTQPNQAMAPARLSDRSVHPYQLRDYRTWMSRGVRLGPSVEFDKVRGQEYVRYFRYPEMLSSMLHALSMEGTQEDQEMRASIEGDIRRISQFLFSLEQSFTDTSRRTANRRDLFDGRGHPLANLYEGEGSLGSYYVEQQQQLAFFNSFFKANNLPFEAISNLAYVDPKNDYELRTSVHRNPQVLIKYTGKGTDAEYLNGLYTELVSKVGIYHKILTDTLLSKGLQIAESHEALINERVVNNDFYTKFRFKNELWINVPDVRGVRGQKIYRIRVVNNKVLVDQYADGHAVPVFVKHLGEAELGEELIAQDTANLTDLEIRISPLENQLGVWDIRLKLDDQSLPKAFPVKMGLWERPTVSYMDPIVESNVANVRSAQDHSREWTLLKDGTLNPSGWRELTAWISFTDGNLDRIRHDMPGWLNLGAEQRSHLERVLDETVRVYNGSSDLGLAWPEHFPNGKPIGHSVIPLNDFITADFANVGFRKLDQRKFTAIFKPNADLNQYDFPLGVLTIDPQTGKRLIQHVAILKIDRSAEGNSVSLSVDGTTSFAVVKEDDIEGVVADAAASTTPYEKLDPSSIVPVSQDGSTYGGPVAHANWYKENLGFDLNPLVEKMAALQPQKAAEFEIVDVSAGTGIASESLLQGLRAKGVKIKKLTLVDINMPLSRDYMNYAIQHLYGQYSDVVSEIDFYILHKGEGGSFAPVSSIEGLKGTADIVLMENAIHVVPPDQRLATLNGVKEIMKPESQFIMGSGSIVDGPQEEGTVFIDSVFSMVRAKALAVINDDPEYGKLKEIVAAADQKATAMRLRQVFPEKPTKEDVLALGEAVGLPMEFDGHLTSINKEDFKPFITGIEGYINSAILPELGAVLIGLFKKTRDLDKGSSEFKDLNTQISGLKALRDRLIDRAYEQVFAEQGAKGFQVPWARFVATNAAPLPDAAMIDHSVNTTWEAKRYTAQLSKNVDKFGRSSLVVKVFNEGEWKEIGKIADHILNIDFQGNVLVVTVKSGLDEGPDTVTDRFDLAHPELGFQSDRAMADYGGIDLNTSSGMKWKLSGDHVEMDINPAMIVRARKEGIKWLSPDILKMTPMSINSVWTLAGLQVSSKARFVAA